MSHQPRHPPARVLRPRRPLRPPTPTTPKQTPRAHRPPTTRRHRTTGRHRTTRPDQTPRVQESRMNPTAPFRPNTGEPAARQSSGTAGAAPAPHRLLSIVFNLRRTDRSYGNERPAAAVL